MSDADGAAPTPPQASPDAAAAGQAPRTIRRSPRWMKVVLVLSLALNLAVAGFAIAHVVAGPRFVAAGPGASMMDARKLLWSLPSEERQALRDEFIGRHHDELMDHRGRWRDARDELARTLARRDASADEIRQAYRAIGEIEAAAAIRWREVLADMTLRVTPEERAVFAERMSHHHGRGGWRDDDGPPDGGEPPPR